MHGGAGNDGLSGAEALADLYSNPASTPVIVFNVATGNFAAFNDTTPLAKIAGHPLNFEATNGGGKVNDGQDVLFGDEGNDWLVGGTQSDHLFGGKGNDIHNADDNLETTVTDAAPFDDADTVYGGGGRDTLIGASGNDRLIDWVGEFNAYAVPFSAFGTAAVMRTIAPLVPEFLYGLSKSDGADQTRVGPGLGTAARNGEPFGELGLFIQQDADFQVQTGSPTDPQAGNPPGGKKLTAAGSTASGAQTEAAGTLWVGWADSPGTAATVSVFVDNTGGAFDGDQLARLRDAFAELSQTWDGTSGVRLVETADRAAANVIVQAATTTTEGGVEEGVLGYFSFSFYLTERGYFSADGSPYYQFAGQGEVTQVIGWDWYAGAAEAVPAGRIDFQTVVTHELGHALGLNHNGDGGSVMFASLDYGQARRKLGVLDKDVLSYLYAGGATPEIEQVESIHSGALRLASPGGPRPAPVPTTDEARALPAAPTSPAPAAPAPAVQPTGAARAARPGSDTWLARPMEAPAVVRAAPAEPVRSASQAVTIYLLPAFQQRAEVGRAARETIPTAEELPAPVEEARAVEALPPVSGARDEAARPAAVWERARDACFADGKWWDALGSGDDTNDALSGPAPLPAAMAAVAAGALLSASRGDRLARERDRNRTRWPQRV